MTTAVVLGASMGGLLAARALAGVYDRVTVVERDALAADGGNRRGVPQDNHFHTLLPRGAQVLEEMFPGLAGDLVAAGARRTGFPDEARFVLSGHELARGVAGAPGLQTTRPMLEAAVRARVSNHPAVRIVPRCDVSGPIVDRGRVVGARVVVDGVDGVLEADLVVDAMGRYGRARAWLTAMGFPTPEEDRIDVDLVCVSRLVRLAEPFRDELVLVGPVPGRTTGLAFAAQEDDRWMVTVFGMAGDHPPTDEADYNAFVKRTAPPDVHDAIVAAEPLGPLRSHRFPAGLRRRYERLRRFPAGLLVFGDALCGLNPVHGQGMTVAALEARALRRCLRDGEHDLAPRFFRAAAEIIDPVWRLNAVADLALPEVDGRRSPATRLLNRYVARLHRVGAHDPVVAGAFVRAAALLDPPSSITRPGVLARVLVGGARRR